MLFTRAILGYNVGANLIPFMAYGSWYIVEECLVKYYDDILVFKRHAKWVTYFHINMVVVDLHKQKLILKMGYFMMYSFMLIVHSSFELNKCCPTWKKSFFFFLF